MADYRARRVGLQLGIIQYILYVRWCVLLLMTIAISRQRGTEPRKGRITRTQQGLEYEGKLFQVIL